MIGKVASSEEDWGRLASLYATLRHMGASNLVALAVHVLVAILVMGKALNVWRHHVDMEPAIDGLKATSDYLTQRYLDTEDNQTELNALYDEKIENLARLKGDRKIIDESIGLIENELRQALGSSQATIGITPKNIVSWKKTQSKRLDKKKLIEKYPDVADDDEIYSTSVTKRLTIKKIK